MKQTELVCHVLIISLGLLSICLELILISHHLHEIKKWMRETEVAVLLSREISAGLDELRNSVGQIKQAVDEALSRKFTLLPAGDNSSTVECFPLIDRSSSLCLP